MKMNKKASAKLATEINNIADILRNMRSIEHFDSFYDVSQYIRRSTEITSSLNGIVQQVMELNPTMLSQETVKKRLFQEISSYVFQDAVSRTDAIESIQSLLNDLMTFHRVAMVRVPFTNIIVDGPEFTLGRVTLEPFNDEQRAKLKEAWGYRELDFERVFSIARLSEPGDDHLSLANARQEIEQTLSLLRGIGVSSSGLRVFASPHLLGQSLTGELTPFFLHDRWIKEGPSEGYPRRLYADTIEGFGLDNIQNLQRFLAAKPSQRPKMLQGVPQALKWLGDSIIPDKLEGRFIKATLALESAIGHVGEDQYITSRGITATLAERTALLLAQGLKERRQIHLDISNFYNKRSDIVHGRIAKHPATSQDLQSFSSYVSDVIRALLSLYDKIDIGTELTDWTITMRYG